MRIAIMGETRFPVLPYGSGGLGRTTHDIATGLLRLGHKVTIYSPEGGEFEGSITKDVHPEWYDVFLDFSHDHSWQFDKVLHLIGDKECKYQPPCAVVQSEYMRTFYPSAKLVPAGVNVDEIPFSKEHGDYLVFAGANISHKQPSVARDIARDAGKELRMLGPEFEVVTEDEKNKIIGHALGLLCPYLMDAAPRLPLEAAACGTPTICLDGDGTKEHVVDLVTGFVCESMEEMTETVILLGGLDRERIRSWVSQNHNNRLEIPQIEHLLEVVRDGEKW